MFKPRWSDIDVLLGTPELLARPQMLTWLKGEKFHQYSHFGNVPTMTERSMVTDSPSDVRHDGETAASQARADEQRGTPQTAMPVTRGRTRWLVDSGTGNHPIWARVFEGRRQDIVKTDEALNLWTSRRVAIKLLRPEYLSRQDWRVNANANQGYSLGGLILNVSGKVIANYWLSHVYPPEVGQAHREADQIGRASCRERV